MIEPFEAELDRNSAALEAQRVPWDGLDDPEVVACRWVRWLHGERLNAELRDQSPTLFEDDDRCQDKASAA